jgi:outer membrane protein assembly factor BamB
MSATEWWLRDIVRGMLFVGERKSRAAVYISSGKMRWRYEGSISVGPAIAMTRTNRTAQKTRLFAADAQSGEVRWSEEFAKPPIDKDREVYLPEDTSLFKTSIGVLRDDTGQAEASYTADKKRLRALRPSDGETLWSVYIPATQLIHVSDGRVLVAHKRRGCSVRSTHGLAQRNGDTKPMTMSLS